MIKNGIAYGMDCPWVFQVKKAREAYLWDQHHKRYIDFTSGWNVANLGWNNEEVSAAVIEQVGRNTYVPMWASDSIQEQYAEQLLDCFPLSLNAVCRTTSGTEANELAMKIARAVTGRKTILGFANSYHGQSLATMALSFPEDVFERIGFMPEGFVQLDFPLIQADGHSDLAQFLTRLDAILDQSNVAAIVLEAGMMTGSGLAYVAEPQFLPAVREITQRHKVLMILDEVGTGFSRCGALFAQQLHHVTPDLITLAKAIANGAGAMGAVITNAQSLEPVIGCINLTSTFGWTPIACAAASATLAIHRRERLWEQAATKGDWLKKQLQQALVDHPKVGNIQGIGCEIGVNFVNNRKENLPDLSYTLGVVERALKKGLHLTCSNQSTIQIMPPLTINSSILEEGVAIFLNCLE